VKFEEENSKYLKKKKDIMIQLIQKE